VGESGLSQRVPTGMALWLALPIAWLFGIAGQLSETTLRSPAVYRAAVWLALASAVALCGWQVQPSTPRWSRWLWCPVILLLAWGSTGWRAQERASQVWPPQWDEVSVRVQVVGLPLAMPGGGWRWDADVLSAPPPPAGMRLPERIRLHADAQAGMGRLRAGQIWALRVRLYEPDGLSNPGGFDATRGLFEQGIRAVGQVRHRDAAPVKVSEPSAGSAGAVDRFRQRVREAIEARVGEGRAAGVLVGLSVGDQSAIERMDWDIFRRTGVAHAVSISGAHIAMLGWLVAWMVRRTWPRWQAGVHVLPAPAAARGLAVLVSALYALVAGWGVPAQRTVLMMALMALLHAGGRRWPWPLVWTLAAACITVLDPWALWQPGFWLSFVAVGILMSSGRDEAVTLPSEGATWRVQAKAAVQELVRTQWRVSLALTPLSLVCFQEVSLVGLLANLLAIPVFTLGITPLSLLGVVCAPLWDLGATLVQITTAVLAHMAAWPWAVWQAPTLPAWLQTLAVVAGGLWVQPMPWHWRLLLWPCLVPVWCLPQSWHLVPPPRTGQFTVMAVDIGQGTAVLLRTARHNLLFDAGGRLPSGVDMGERVLVPLLRSLGVHELDMLMISHADTDHVGGALSVLAALPVHELRTTLDESHEVRQWQRPRRRVGVAHAPCVTGQRWQWDGVQFEILHPGADETAQRERLKPNALSCVLRVSTTDASSRSVLLTGDIEAEQERALLARQRATQAASEPGAVLRSTVLIAPHHGSQTSSTQAFLQAVQPVQTVVQVGRRNRYGHPAPVVLARFAALGLPLVSSPMCGAYLWRSDERLQALAMPSHLATSGQPVLGQCWRALSPRYWDAGSVQRRHAAMTGAP
jgi:competence protein ComEC